MDQIVQPTVAASLVVLLFVLVDRVIVPLVKGSPKASNGTTHQNYVNKIHEDRLNDHSQQHVEHRAALNQIGITVATIKAIVERIEQKQK